MKLGIRAHDLGENTPENFATAVADAKFNAIQLVLRKAIQFNDWNEMVETVSTELKAQKIDVAMLGAYFNPIHSDKVKVAEAVENFKNHLRLTKTFDTLLVGTETGSYNDDQWTYHEKNSSEEAFAEVKRIFTDILPVAEEMGAYLTIEPAAHHVITTPTRLKRLIDELDHKNIRVTFDLFNLLDNHNYNEQHRLIDEMVAFFKDKIAIVHAKDFIVTDGVIEQVAPGKGLLDYPYLLEKLQLLDNEPTIIFEGVTGSDIEFSRVFLNEVAQRLSN